MLVSDVITDAKYGELRNLAVKDDDIAVISFINSAMIALYDRFKLKTKEQVIAMQDNVVEYDLNDDAMTVLAVYDENGDEFSINDETNLFGVFLPSYGTIQVANPNAGANLGVVYLASPVRLTDVSEVVRIPPQLLEPMLHYIGYRAHGSVDGSIQAENNTHLMRYEAKCKSVEASGSIRKDVVPGHINMQEGISEIDITYQEENLNG